jgi:hypothetical protein
MMPPGAPRKTSFTPDEMIDLGQEMIQWLKEHPETVHLKEWYSIEKMFLYNEWKAFIQLKEFLPYYELALAMISLKYIKLETGIEPSLKHRFLRSYFKDIREQEDKDKDDDVIRQKSAAEAVPEDVLKQTQAMNQQMAQLRADLSGKGLRLGQSSSVDQSLTPEQP